MNKLSGDALNSISTEDIFSNLSTQSYMKSIHTDLMLKIKETECYKQILVLANAHIFDLTSSHSDKPCSKEVLEKKKDRTSEIGALALDIDTTMPQICAEGLKEKPVQAVMEIAVKQAIKEKLKDSTTGSDEGGESSGVSTMDSDDTLPLPSKRKKKALNDIISHLKQKKMDSREPKPHSPLKNGTENVTSAIPEKDSSKTLPIRQRKPNSKYSSFTN